MELDRQLDSHAGAVFGSSTSQARRPRSVRALGVVDQEPSPRQVWLSEAGDFTPWLAENIDVLAEELGEPLTVIAQEVPVGDFRLDIQAQTQDGRTVVIENQLERTDHSHLGQLLVYASGLEAAAVVWVAPRFRDEFRRTLDWLNERTDTGVDFFGVEVGVVQVGDQGPRAPVFEVVARPNDWQKGVKGGGPKSPPSTLNEARQQFFAEVLEGLAAQRAAIRVPRPQNQNWMAYASGPFGNWGLVFGVGGQLRIEIYLDTGDQETTKRLFDGLMAEAAQWAERIGIELQWERLDDRRASRIAVYYPAFDLDDGEQRALARTWCVGTALTLYDHFDAELRLRARALRGHRGQV